MGTYSWNNKMIVNHVELSTSRPPAGKLHHTPSRERNEKESIKYIEGIQWRERTQRIPYHPYHLLGRYSYKIAPPPPSDVLPLETDTSGDMKRLPDVSRTR